MAHRTRRRAVLRDRREHAQERENVRIENIAIDKFKRGRIRYDDLLDGPRVPGVFGEVVFARGVVTADVPTIRTAEEYERLMGRKWPF